MSKVRFDFYANFDSRSFTFIEACWYSLSTHKSIDLALLGFHFEVSWGWKLPKHIEAGGGE